MIENSYLYTSLDSLTASSDTDLERHGAKLLNVRAVVSNVEAERRVAVIINDPHGRILTFRCFTTTASRGNECDRCKCVTMINTLFPRFLCIF